MTNFKWNKCRQANSEINRSPRRVQVLATSLAGGNKIEYIMNYLQKLNIKISKLKKTKENR